MGPIPISNMTKDYFKLSEGEEVIIYTEDIQVNARIMFDNEQASWCIGRNNWSTYISGN